MSDKADKDSMLGLWDLISYARTEADGSVTHPFGTAPVGRLLYTPDGYMTAHIMPGGAGAEDMAAVSTVAYCGDWRLDGGEVFHEVLVGSNTIQTGSTVSRRVTWEGEDLILSADGWQQGAPEGSRSLRWKRVA